MGFPWRGRFLLWEGATFFDLKWASKMNPPSPPPPRVGSVFPGLAAPEPFVQLTLALDSSVHRSGSPLNGGPDGGDVKRPLGACHGVARDPVEARGVGAGAAGSHGRPCHHEALPKIVRGPCVRGPSLFFKNAPTHDCPRPPLGKKMQKKIVKKMAKKCHAEG